MASVQHRVCLMAGDTVARSVNKFIYIRVGGQIRWIYPPLNKPKSLAAIASGRMRVKCKYCDVDLTDDLKEVQSSGQLKEVDGEDFINRGQFFISDGDYYTNTETQIIINKDDLKNSKNHSDPSRLNGCCGLDGLDGLNKVCVNGHEIGTEKSDCWMAHSIIFDNKKIKTN